MYYESIIICLQQFRTRDRGSTPVSRTMGLEYSPRPGVSVKHGTGGVVFQRKAEVTIGESTRIWLCPSSTRFMEHHRGAKNKPNTEAPVNKQMQTQDQSLGVANGSGNCFLSTVGV